MTTIRKPTDPTYTLTATTASPVRLKATVALLIFSSGHAGPGLEYRMVSLSPPATVSALAICTVTVVSPVTT